MAVNVATLVASLRMDTRDFKAGAQTASREVQGLEKVMGKGERASAMFTRGLQLLAVTGAARLGKELFQAGVQAEAFERRFDTVFGEVSESMEEWIDQQNELFGLSESGLKGLASQVGDLLVPLGLTRDAAARTSQEVLTLANALSEWVGGTRDASEVVNIITRAMLGEREALIGLGVKVSEADVQQRLAAKGMENLTGTALTQARAMETLGLITERSADALTAYEAGGSDALRAQKSLTASLGDLRDAGAELIIKLTPLIEGFADLVGGLADLVGLSEDADRSWLVLSERIDKFSGVSGQAANQAALLITNLRDMGKDGVAGQAAQGQQFAIGAEVLRDYWLQLGLTTAELEDLASVTGAIGVPAGFFNEAIGESLELTDTWHRNLQSAAAAAGDLDSATQGAAEAVKSLSEAQRDAADPILSAMDAFDKWVSVVEQANEDGEITSDELREMARAVLEMNAAFDALTPEQYQEGILAIAAALGITEAAARDLIATWGGFADLPLPPSLAPTGPSGGQHRMHGGGVVPGSPGMEVPIIAQAGEIVLPASHRFSGSGGGGVNVYVAGSVVTERDLADTIRRELIDLSISGS